MNGESSKARVILIDDHDVLRGGLRELVASTPDLEVVAEAASGAEAERLARTVSADLMILDIGLPDKGGIAVLETLRAEGVTLPVLLFSMHPGSQYVAVARRAGAQGFVCKSDSSDQVLRAARRILEGATSFLRRAPTRLRSEADPFAALSRREHEVMRLLLRGDSLRDIATHLGVGDKSVSTYRRRLLDKVGVGSNAELAALAVRHGRT